MEPIVGIIGAGRVGTAVGILLRRAGYPIGGVACRSVAHSAAAVARIGAGIAMTDPVAVAQGSRILFLTVPDQSVAAMATQLAAARALTAVEILIHTSGVLPAAVMNHRNTDDPVWHLSLHPMQSIADPVRGAEQLAGAFWGVEGDPAAIAMGVNLVQAMGGTPLPIQPGQKGLYHAAACTVSNYLVSLMDAGLHLMAGAGIEGPAALPVLSTLMAGTLANIRQVGVPAALTGPIERGDADTIAEHLAALAAIVDKPTQDRLMGLYRAVGLYTVGVAQAKTGPAAPGQAAADATDKEGQWALMTRQLEGRGAP